MLLFLVRCCWSFFILARHSWFSVLHSQLFFSFYNSPSFLVLRCRSSLFILTLILYSASPILHSHFHFFFFPSAIPAKAQPQLLAAPERRTAAQAQAAAGGFSMKSTKRFLGGEVPDPARIKHHPTHFWIKLSAVLNVFAGAAYIWWRAARSMPENPVRYVFFVS